MRALAPKRWIRPAGLPAFAPRLGSRSTPAADRDSDTPFTLLILGLLAGFMALAAVVVERHRGVGVSGVEIVPALAPPPLSEAQLEWELDAMSGDAAFEAAVAELFAEERGHGIRRSPSRSG